MAYVDQSREDLDPEKTVCRRFLKAKRRSSRRSADELRGYVSSFNFWSDAAEEGRDVFRRRAKPRSPSKEGDRGVNVLLLDEPTNDLDANTLLALKRGWRISPAARWLFPTTAGFWTGS